VQRFAAVSLDLGPAVLRRVHVDLERSFPASDIEPSDDDSNAAVNDIISVGSGNVAAIDGVAMSNV
jgi:hypothetical protein